MKALIWLLAMAALAVGLAVAARYNQGYVLTVIPPWRVEISLNLFLLLLAAGYVVVYLLSRSFSHLLTLPRRVANFQQQRRHDRAELALYDAWRLIQEGRYGQALKSAERAWPDHAVPGLVALAGWRAATALRDPQRAAPWVARVQEMDAPQLDVARLMMEADLALNERRFDDARSALAQAIKKGGRHIAALRLCLRAEQGLGNWQEVARLTRQLEKYKGLTADQAVPLRRHAIREVIAGLREDGAPLLSYWRTVDADDRLDPAVAIAAAEALTATGQSKEAQHIIENALDSSWDVRLVLAYGGTDGTGGAETPPASADNVSRIAQAEAWLQNHPQDGALLLTLGRLCRRQQLWGKARSYLEVALSLLPSREVNLELAQLYETLHEPTLAAERYRAAALL